MQAALCIAPTVLPLTPCKVFSQQAISQPKLGSSLTSRCPPLKATAATYDTSSTFDYSSAFSVFPAEACETIGGDACLAEMYPEARLQPEARNERARASEAIEREYFEYNESKTVFKAEACDDLGGIFCEREYQRGVY